MECKGSCADLFRCGAAVLIETLWNVKDSRIACAIIGLCTVLIETLWNVKVIAVIAAIVAALVLIETLWNVKTAFLLPG